MLSIYFIIRRIDIVYLRLDQAIIIFLTFSNPNFIMSKRFESGVSKRKRKKIENDMIKKIEPITAFLHQPLTEATGAGTEVGALTLAQENLCDDQANQPTASIQTEENLIEKAMRDVEQQLGNEEAPYPAKMKIQISFKTQLLQRKGKKKHMKVVETVKIFSSHLVK